jgi:hypothetical protein
VAIWTDLTFRHKSRFWWKFAITSPETLHMKNVIHKHSFPLVTHTSNFDTRFGRYRLLKSGWGDELFWTDWTSKWNPSSRGPKWVNLGKACLRIPYATWSAFQHLLIHTFMVTTAMVTAIWRHPTCGVQRIAVNQNRKWFGLGLGFRIGEDYDFWGCYIAYSIW